MTVQDYSLQLAFYKVRAGNEIDVYQDIRDNNDLFYKVVGEQDILRIRLLNTFDDIIEPEIAPNIKECSSLLCFAVYRNIQKQEVMRQLDEHFLLLTFFKLSSQILRKNACESECGICSKITELAEGRGIEAMALTSLGFAESIVFLKGKNMPELLEFVTQMRGQYASGVPLFSYTLSLPLVSISQVIEPAKYDTLKGQISAITRLKCHPGYEPGLFNDAIHHGFYSPSYIYGNTDLCLFRFDDNIGNILQHLVELRRNWKQKTGLVSTHTNILNNATEQRHRDQGPQIADKQQTSTYLDDIFLELKALVTSMPGKEEIKYSVRRITYIILQVVVFLSDPELSHGLDTAYTILSFCKNNLANYQKLFNKAGGDSPTAIYAQRAMRDIEHSLSSSAEFLLHLIKERTLNVERSNELDVEPWMTSGGIQRIIMAAEVIPNFIFRNFYATAAILVSFGKCQSPSMKSNHFLLMPSAAIYDPLNSWWKMTHETAHAIFLTMKIWNVNRELAERTLEGAPTHLMVKYEVSECFASWFDYRHVFCPKRTQEERRYYFILIWRSWLQVAAVHSDPLQYISRSFAVWLIDEPVMFDEKRLLTAAVLEKKYDEFLAFLTENITGFKEMEIRPEFKQHAITLFDRVFGPWLRLFEKEYKGGGNGTLISPKFYNCDSALNSYDPESVEEQIKMIKNGNIVTERISNPKALLFTLTFAGLQDSNRELQSIKTTVALILSLYNSAMEQVGG